MKKIGAGLVVAGMILISMTFIVEWQNKAKQAEILTNYEEKVNSNIDYSNHNDTLAGNDEGGGMFEETEIGGEVSSSDQSVITIEEYDVAGVLSIERIGLNAPVLVGASDENLEISVATVFEKEDYLDSNNLAIAGHNWKEYGRGFNRIYELEKGDVILFSDSTMDYKYTVTQKFIAEDDDLWVLNASEDKTEITLITCVFGGDKRQVIKGAYVEAIERENLQ